MGPAGIIAIIAAVVIVVIISYIISIYNNLIRLKENIDATFHNIEVALANRHDTIVKLLGSVKSHFANERQTFLQVTQARNAYETAKTMPEKANADAMMQRAIASIKVTVEKYPDLKSNESVAKLMTSIINLETALSDMRQLYNNNVRIFNFRINAIPDLFIANMMRLKEFEGFIATEEQKKDVEIAF